MNVASDARRKKYSVHQFNLANLSNYNVESLWDSLL